MTHSVSDQRGLAIRGWEPENQVQPKDYSVLLREQIQEMSRLLGKTRCFLRQLETRVDAKRDIIDELGDWIFYISAVGFALSLFKR